MANEDRKRRLAAAKMEKPYQYEEYPRMMYRDGETLQVLDDDERDDAEADGWTAEAPARPQPKRQATLARGAARRRDFGDDAARAAAEAGPEAPAQPRSPRPARGPKGRGAKAKARA